MFGQGRKRNDPIFTLFQWVRIISWPALSNIESFESSMCECPLTDAIVGGGGGGLFFNSPHKHITQREINRITRNGLLKSCSSSVYGVPIPAHDTTHLNSCHPLQNRCQSHSTFAANVSKRPTHTPIEYSHNLC